MALQINKEQTDGVTVAYWKISHIAFDMNAVDTNNDSLVVTIEGYLDSTARTAGKPAVTTVTETLTVDYTVLAGDLRDEIYDRVKLLSGWTTATDV